MTKGCLTEAEANGVSWSVSQGSMPGIDIYYEEVAELDVDAYIPFAFSMVDVDVASAGIESGTRSFGVVEATNSEGNSVDFTVAVNQGATSASGIKNIFYNSSTGSDEYIGNIPGAIVSAGNYYGQTSYVNVLDCPLQMMISGGIVSNYRVYNYGGYSNPDYVITSFSFSNGLTLSNGEGDEDAGWMFGVYDASGSLVQASTKAAADFVSLKDGDTVVWKYGVYETTSFSPTVPTVPEQ